MESQLISVVIDKEMYDLIKQYCFDNRVRIKEFIGDALCTKLEGKGVYYGKKSVKR